MRKVLALVLLAASTGAAAQTTTSPVPIKQLVAGWGYDSFSISIGTALPNPAGCPSNDMAVVSLDSPGYKTYYAAALTAFNSDSPVSLVLSNTACEGPRPRIIGIQLGH